MDINEKPILPACMVAHDCRNLLSVIIGHCDLALEKIPEASEIAKRVSIIRGAAIAIAATFDNAQCRFSDMVQADSIQKWPGSPTQCR